MKILLLKGIIEDFVDVKEVISIAKNLGMKVDDIIDYHLITGKGRLKMINLCEPNLKNELIEKIQIFEREVSEILNVKEKNKLIHNKYSYSSTLVLKKNI